MRLIVGFLLVGLSVWAQNAQLGGQVADASGQAVAGATVTVVNEATRIRREVVTGNEGLYVFPGLLPGNYSLRIAKAGFKSLDRSGIVLTVDARGRVDATLEVGSVSESVTVTENVGQLQVDSPEVSTTITQSQVQNLPLVQLGRVRVAASFIYLAAGVQGNVRVDGADNLAASNQIRVHGSGTFQHEFWVDGLPAGQMGQIGNFNESAPPVEAMREFKLQTSQLAADYGHTGQAVTSFVLKSGANQLHGSAFEYFRNDKLDARSWFAATRATTRQNEFGVTIGGPVLLPKVYSGRDKTFFFFSWTSSRRRGLDNFNRVQTPTGQNLRGDFSDWRNAAGNLIPIYDPASTRPNGTGGFTRDVFAGNRIPVDRFDPVSAKIAAFYPQPNTAGTLNLGAFIGEKQLDPDIFTVRGDHSITSNEKVYFSFNSTAIPRFRIDNPLPDPLTSGIIQNITSQMYRVGLDSVLRPNLINNLVLGVNRFRNPVDPVTVDRGWPEKLGLKGVTGDRFPVLSFGDGYVGAASGGITDNIDAVYMFKNTASWTRGRSNWRFGGEYRWNHLNNRAVTNTQGSLSFTNLATALPGTPAGTGNSFASFLLGEVGSGNVRLAQNAGIRRTYTGFFVQNDFKATSRLTLNIGLRWEFMGAPFEQQDRYSVVDLSRPNPAAGNKLGALIYAGTGAGREGARRLTDADYSAWGPRAGFAYQVNSKTVLRGGYGLYYADNYLSISSSGFNLEGTFQTLDNGITPGFRLRDGFPQNFPREPRIDPALLNGQSASFLEAASGAMPRTQNWNFGFQRDLGREMVLEVNYIGNRSTRQVAPELSNINQVDPKYLSLGQLLTSNINSAAARAANIPIPWGGFNGSVAQALRAYPQYLTLTSQQAKISASTYHGAEFKFRKRFASGFSFDVSYVRSKAIGLNAPGYQGFGGLDNMLQNHYDLRSERSLLSYDIPNAFVAHYIYTLPFGKSGWRKALLGDWTISGIHRYQSGYPLQLSMNNLLPIFNRVLRPDLVGNVDPSSGIGNADFDPGRGDRVVNPRAFASPVVGGVFRFGNMGPTMDALRQFPVLQEDFVLTKRFALRESAVFEIQSQFFNAFNRHRFVNFEPNFSSPNFGAARGTNLPRFVQLGAKVTF
ncbi:MAG: TonB-dependent receptor [Acidobacteria bacterium]|nr:TonB-dependent receptor [Acidobacteriota bacterium]